MNSPPTASFVYRPLAGFHGTDSFTYRADDGNTAACAGDGAGRSAFAGAAQSETTEWVYGDANRDGRVDAADVNFVLRHQFARLGMAAYDPAADIDGDGRVNVRDAVLVRNRIGLQPSADAVIRMTLPPTAVDSVLTASDSRQRLALVAVIGNARTSRPGRRHEHCVRFDTPLAPPFECVDRSLPPASAGGRLRYRAD